MSSETKARQILWPEDANVVLRACFLYVGQGSAILLLVRDSDTYRALLVDCNMDKKNGGINVPTLVKDIVNGDALYAFVNTHPHDDHLRGIDEVREAVTVDRVWHTGFEPGNKRGNEFGHLEDLIADVRKRNGDDAIVVMRGSKSSQELLDAEFFTLAPAKHVQDSIDEDDDEKRYRRIHEQCAVLRFGAGDSWVLVTGDADLVAFKEHITEYHKDRLQADVLDASHHGSRSFFKKDEDDEPYLDALEAIDPTFVVISAPTQEESPHDHPHDDAVELYTDHVGDAEKVLHTGAEREVFFFDILEDGTISEKRSDDGALAEHYGLDQDDDGDDGGGGGKNVDAKGPFQRPPATGKQKRKKYAGLQHAPVRRKNRV